ncbi:hypothetical protein MIDIC_420016 [Alphaproteobacteria bacterium]
MSSDDFKTSQEWLEYIEGFQKVRNSSKKRKTSDAALTPDVSKIRKSVAEKLSNASCNVYSITALTQITNNDVSHKPQSWLEIDQHNGLDRRTIYAMDRGEYSIAATLDLHCHTMEQAHATLQNFILSAYQQQKRFLLIVTGKGSNQKSDGNDTATIREMLPCWLNSKLLRPCILRFRFAIKKHGGEGAFYVLLKRERGPVTHFHKIADNKSKY